MSVERFKEIYAQLTTVPTTYAARTQAAVAIYQTEYALTPMWWIEGREAVSGPVLFNEGALRWELGPGGANSPIWDTATIDQIIGELENLGNKVHRAQ